MATQADAPSPYCYQPLSDAQNTARILVLMPATEFSAPLHGALAEGRFANGDWQDAPYEALSYVWGSTNSGHYITCDQPDGSSCGRVPVTENCDVALRHLRSRQQPRRLWVDVICINQQDISERSLQIRIMANIYSCAEQTTLWLGTESPVSTFAYRAIGVATFLAKLKAIGTYLVVASNMFIMPYYARKAKSHPLDIFADMYHRPWFSRMWTLQELYFSKAVVVRIGDLTILWDKFHSAANTFGFMCCKKDSLGGVDSRQCARLLETTGIVQSLRGRGSWLASVEAPRLLLACRQQGASELRDKVFALYSILKDPWAESNAPLPDYNLSIPDVFRWATILTLRPGNAPWNIFLGVCNCQRRIQNLSSWSPDYSHSHPIPEKADLLCWPLRHDLHKPSFSDEGRVLHLQVVYVTSVMATAHWQAPPTNTPNDIWSAIISNELQGVVDQRKGWLGASPSGPRSTQNFWIIDLARKSRFFKHWFDTTAEAMGCEALLEKLSGLLELQLSLRKFFFQAWHYIFLGIPLSPSILSKIYQADISRASISWETEDETVRSIARFRKLAALGATNPKFLVYEMACEIHEVILSFFSDYTVLILRSGILALGYPGVQCGDQIGFATVPLVYRPSGDCFRMISPAFMAIHDAMTIYQSTEAGREFIFD